MKQIIHIHVFIIQQYSTYARGKRVQYVYQDLFGERFYNFINECNYITVSGGVCTGTEEASETSEEQEYYKTDN